MMNQGRRGDSFCLQREDLILFVLFGCVLRVLFICLNGNLMLGEKGVTDDFDFGDGVCMCFEISLGGGGALGGIFCWMGCVV